MTKQDYMDQVAGARSLPKRYRQEILRDLEELFDCAQEQGEDLQAVIRRLGPPNEFVENLLQERGIPRRRGVPVGLFGCGILAVLCLLSGGVLWWRERTAPLIIGGAQGTTDILVEGDPLVWWLLLLVVGAILALGTGLWYGLIRRGRGA